MAEYIEKDNLIRWIERQKRLSKLHTILAIQDTPASDVVPVVRCKDCKRRYIPNSPTGKPFCTAQFLMEAKDDDFCSYGERREGE